MGIFSNSADEVTKINYNVDQDTTDPSELTLTGSISIISSVAIRNSDSSDYVAMYAAQLSRRESIRAKIKFICGQIARGEIEI